MREIIQIRYDEDFADEATLHVYLFIQIEFCIS
jgi:hypothetical protein